jgi:hypothetical protein
MATDTRVIPAHPTKAIQRWSPTGWSSSRARPASMASEIGWFAANSSSGLGMLSGGTKAPLAGQRPEQRAHLVGRLLAPGDQADDRQQPGEGVREQNHQAQDRQPAAQIGLRPESNQQPHQHHRHQRDHAAHRVGHHGAAEDRRARHRQRAESVNDPPPPEMSFATPTAAVVPIKAQLAAMTPGRRKSE